MKITDRLAKLEAAHQSAQAPDRPYRYLIVEAWETEEEWRARLGVEPDDLGPFVVYVVTDPPDWDVMAGREAEHEQAH